MKANELRIGNLVQHKYSGIIKTDINAISIVEIQNREDIEEIYSPIPLTEEWLLKFGFVKLGKLDFFYISEQEMNFKVSCDLKMIAWYNLQLHGVEIKHVHQLQNLYFALTNTEL